MKIVSALAIVGLLTPIPAVAAPIDNLGLMVMIKFFCKLDPPDGVYEREFKRHLEQTGQKPSETAMAMGLDVMKSWYQIGPGGEVQFCEDVKKVYSDNFYGK